VWWVAGGGRLQASLLLVLLPLLALLGLGRFCFLSGLFPVEARISQPLRLWSFESPWTCSGGGFSPPSPVIIECGLVFSSGRFSLFLAG
jgi:hypothetical protein